MNASKLFPEISNLILLDDIEVKSLEIDSRKVKKGSVFFACKGNSLDLSLIHISEPTRPY